MDISSLESRARSESSHDSGDGVVMVVFTEGMAPEYALQRKEAALHGPVLLNGLYCVGRAGGIIPTASRKTGRDVFLIESDEKEEYAFHSITFLKLGNMSVGAVFDRLRANAVRPYYTRIYCVGSAFKMPALSASCR